MPSFMNILLFSASALINLSCAQDNTVQNVDNYFIQPPASDKTAWDNPWVLQNDTVYQENQSINVTWKTNQSVVDITLWKYDNNTNQGLSTKVCSTSILFTRLTRNLILLLSDCE